MPDRTERRTTFEDLYARNADPWDCETSEYERGKRDRAIAALGNRHFGIGFEVGCSTGFVTERLAPRCGSLTCIDVADNALAIARRRLEPFDNVTLLRAEVPQFWPEPPLDLVVLSEVLYFLSAQEIAAVSQASFASLTRSGYCLLVNWTGPNDLPVGGDRAVAIFENAADWHCDLRETHRNYRIDRYATGPQAEV